MNAYLASLSHASTADRITAERACLAVLEGSCRTPIAAYAEWVDGGLRLRALIAQPDGSAVHRREASAPSADAVRLGVETGRRLKDIAGADFLR